MAKHNFTRGLQQDLQFLFIGPGSVVVVVSSTGDKYITKLSPAGAAASTDFAGGILNRVWLCDHARSLKIASSLQHKNLNLCIVSFEQLEN